MTDIDVTSQDKQAQEAHAEIRAALNAIFDAPDTATLQELREQFKTACTATNMYNLLRDRDALSQGTQPTVDQASMSLLSDARIDEIIVSTLGLDADEYAMAEFARVVEAAVLAALPPVERSQPVAVESWKVETKPDGVRFRIGNQGFRLADSGPDDWPGRQEFLARMLTKALEHLVPEPAQGAGLTGYATPTKEHAEWLRSRHPIHHRQGDSMTPPPLTEEREAFEAWMTNVAKIIIGSTDPYPAGLERDYWKVWKAALEWNRRQSAGATAEEWVKAKDKP